MREPAEYGNDEVPIPVFYILEITRTRFGTIDVGSDPNRQHQAVAGRSSRQ